MDNSSAHKAQDPTTSNISFADYGRWDDYANARMAEIDKNYKITGDAQAADAALQKLGREHEAREEAGIVDPPLDWLELVPAPEDDPPKAEPKAVAPAVVEQAGELDAAGVEAIERAEAVAEAYEHQPDKPSTAPIAEMRAWRARNLAPACKEFGIDPTDPMAEQKLKVARNLKPFKLTLADLEAYCPEFWSLPLKTMPKEGKKSRAWVLKTFKWRGYDEETSTARTKLEDDKRREKREAKIAAKGWPADYYELPPDERRTINKRIAKQRAKAK